MCFGLNCVPPQKKIYAGVLIPSILECDLIWGWGLCRDKMRSLGCALTQ